MNIQWYPGHMTKTKRQIMKDIALVDIVLELLDARIANSSRNPDILELAAGKKHIVILNKADLADGNITAEWKRFYERQGTPVITANSTATGGASGIFDMAAGLMKEKTRKNLERGRIGTTTRAIVMGIPNVGKSTLINRCAKRTAAVSADKPGVTRGRQWIRVSADFELLDTPGILWPKVDDPGVGVKLAVTGAVKDTILDMPSLASACITLLRSAAPSVLTARYGIEFDGEETSDNVLESIAKARGFLLKGGVLDIERAAVTLLDEYRGGKLGRVSLERPHGIRSAPQTE